MKTLKCDMCDKEFSAEDFGGWMQLMREHYGKDHMDVMASKADIPNKEEEMKKWMDEAKQRFDAAPEM